MFKKISLINICSTIIIISKIEKVVAIMVDKLLNRFGNLVKGTITGFDRLIFKGHLKPIIFAGGMQSLLYNKNVLIKIIKNG